MFSLACNLTKNDIQFLPSKFRRKKHVLTTWIFQSSKLHRKKASGKNIDISISKITSRKVRGKNMDFSTSKITLKKNHGNNVDFWTIEITAKKVRGNDVDFSTIEITLKKYVETTQKFIEIGSSTYWCNIGIESASIRRGVPFGLLLHNFQTRLKQGLFHS